MFGSMRPDPAQRQSLERIEAWTRARFDLASDAVVMVSEVQCSQPGCPPLETVIAFWTAPDARHHCKVFKPVQQVVVDDLPYAWMKASLRAVAGEGCECC
jgi:hypothetical protein